MAKLFVVSTPVGNLDDLTRRAEEVLGSVSVVFAEDTRRTRVLLEHLGIRTTLTSLHAHNEERRVSSVLSRLEAGEDVALVSDAGTPLVSDPGSRLCAAVLDAGHELVPVPGASAVLAALVASGLPADRFTFLGFVPRKGPDRRAALERVADSEETTVLFESPQRIVRLLSDLSGYAGAERGVAVGREMTKLHEAFFRGTLAEAASYYEEHAPRGEVTLVVAPRATDAVPNELDEAVIRAVAGVLLDRGLRASEAAREVARRLGVPRRSVYDTVRSVRQDGPRDRGGIR